MDDRDPLPLHIIDDILSRLHVKQLLRLRCVSKTWRDLIDGPYFIKLHLSRNRTRHRSVITLGIEPRDTLYEVKYENGCIAAKLDHPWMDSNQSIEVVGSCNGLLCTSTGTFPQTLAIWNPSTRKHRLLPTTTTIAESKWGNCFLYGFGYDLTHDDYKLVRIASGFVDGCFRQAAEVKVYSLARNSWKRIQDISHCRIIKQTPGVYASGALHWIAGTKYDRPDFILALDLSDEGYKELPLPPPVLWGTTACCVQSKYFGVLDDGCLCLVSDYDRGIPYSHLWLSHVWVMREYGVKDSWTKLFSISGKQVIASSAEYCDCSQPFEHLEPLAYHEGGTQLLMAHNKINFLVYDLNTNQATVHWVEPDIAPMPGVPYICSQSLVNLIN